MRRLMVCCTATTAAVSLQSRQPDTDPVACFDRALGMRRCRAVSMPRQLARRDGWLLNLIQVNEVALLLLPMLPAWGSI
jgi:hypothetical protein